MMILPLLALTLPCLFHVPPSAPDARDPAVLVAAETVEELLARGRELYTAGKLDEALAAFEAAEALERGSLRTRVHVLRTWIAQGRIEDALGETDALKQAHKQGVEIDYLYGVGFYAMAARDVAAGQSNSGTGSQFEDAVNYLKRAAEKNDARFDDAWLLLAEAAWYAQNADVGKLASEKALEQKPADPWRHLLRGRLAMQAFTLWKDDEAKAGAAEGQWQAAVAAFEKAVLLCGAEPDATLRPAALQGLVQLGQAFLWKQQVPDASAAFTRAIVLDPSGVDYATISSGLTATDFADTLDKAHDQWLGKNPEPSAKDALLCWWMGYANYGAKRFPEAEAAFETALEKNPSFSNSWYYLFRTRYDQRKFADSLDTLRSYYTQDPAGAVGSLAYDVPGNVARLEYLVGWAATPENHGGKANNHDAALMCELITQVVPRLPENSRHWNNLGLFLRDEGEAIRGTQGALTPAPKPYDEAKVNQLWEASLAAYEVALELEPKNPNYLNDTAVMLHYYFIRDLERAKAMYELGYAEATALLKRTDLSTDQRRVIEIAHRDNGNNIRLVQKLIEKRAAEAAAPKDEKPADQ